MNYLKQLLFVFFTLFSLVGEAWAGGAKTVWVDSYTRKDGTYVSGHWRSSPGSSVAELPSSLYDGSSSLHTTGSRDAPKYHAVYRYDIDILEGGKEICRDALNHGDSLHDTHEAAAVSSTWKMQECLRAEFYRGKMNHEGVAAMISSVFSKTACKLESGISYNGSLEIHESTMTCLIMSKEEQKVLELSSRTYPFKCRAMQDRSASSTKCQTAAEVVTLYHAGEGVFGAAEAKGLFLTVSKLSDGSLTVAADGDSRIAQVSLVQQSNTKK